MALTAAAKGDALLHYEELEGLGDVCPAALQGRVLCKGKAKGFTHQTYLGKLRRQRSMLKLPSLAAAHAAAPRSRSPPACSGLPSRPKRRALAAWLPRRGYGGGAPVPTQGRRSRRLWPPRWRVAEADSTRRRSSFVELSRRAPRPFDFAKLAVTRLSRRPRNSSADRNSDGHNSDDAGKSSAAARRSTATNCASSLHRESTRGGEDFSDDDEDYNNELEERLSRVKMMEGEVVSNSISFHLRRLSSRRSSATDTSSNRTPGKVS